MRRQTLWGTRLPPELVEKAGKGSETTMPLLDGPGRLKVTKPDGTTETVHAQAIVLATGFASSAADARIKDITVLLKPYGADALASTLRAELKRPG